MIKKRKLELTWIGRENRPRSQPLLRLVAADEDESQPGSSAHSQEALLKPCARPRCGCLSILIDFQPPFASGDLWLDLGKKSLIPSAEQKEDSEFLRLDEILRAQLTDADRQRLREWFFAEKLEFIETTPVSEIEIADLPNADDGRMVGFIEVFPCGLSLNFTMENENWAADEQYCVKPDCTCRETVLSFLKLKDAAGKISASISNPPALYYNYQSQTSHPLAAGPADSPSCDRLLAALKGAHPNLDARLEHHHLLMQALYARGEVARTKPLLKPLIAATSHKIGRNEPCPCGSGRKFKHCCLNKSAP